MSLFSADPQPAKFHLTGETIHDIVVEPIGTASFELDALDPETGISTVNNEVFEPSALTFQSIVTVSSTPSIMTLHVVSDLTPDPEGGAKYSGTQWINIGIGIGGSF